MRRLLLLSVVLFFTQLGVCQAGEWNFLSVQGSYMPQQQFDGSLQILQNGVWVDVGNLVAPHPFSGTRKVGMMTVYEYTYSGLIQVSNVPQSTMVRLKIWQNQNGTFVPTGAYVNPLQ